MSVGVTSLLFFHWGDRLRSGRLGIPPPHPGCHDVPVIMQPEFQQSFLFVFLEMPQIQFMIKVPDIPVVCSDGYAQCKTVQNTGDSTVYFLGVVVNAPVVVQRQVPGMVQTVLKPWVAAVAVF